MTLPNFILAVDWHSSLPVTECLNYLFFYLKNSFVDELTQYIIFRKWIAANQELSI